MDASSKHCTIKAQKMTKSLSIKKKTNGGGDVTQQSRMRSARIAHSNHLFSRSHLAILSSYVSKTAALKRSEIGASYYQARQIQNVDCICKRVR